MTDELFIPDDKIWDEDEAIEGTGKTLFYRAKLFYPLRVSFKKTSEGGTFTLPEVFEDDYETKVRVGPLQFNGKVIDKNSKLIMAIWVKEFDTQDGRVYQKVVSMHNWNESYNPEKELDDAGSPLSGKKPNLWLDLQKKEFTKLSKAQLSELTKAALNKGKWVYCSSVEASTNFPGPWDKKTYDTDIKLYPNKEEWEKAREEHFAQFGGNGTGPAADYYPAVWGDNTSIGQMIEHGQSMKDSKEPAEIAQELMLYDGSEPALTAKGEPCNVIKIMSEVLGVPEPMVKL